MTRTERFLARLGKEVGLPLISVPRLKRARGLAPFSTHLVNQVPQRQACPLHFHLFLLANSLMILSYSSTDYFRAKCLGGNR
jgi:hypothetical protein